MKESQIIDERIATEVLGWTLIDEEEYQNRMLANSYSFNGLLAPNERRREMRHAWGMFYEDWNKWRQVEEKILGNELFDVFMANWCLAGDARSLMVYCEADLPTRCEALISALDSLKQS